VAPFRHVVEWSGFLVLLFAFISIFFWAVELVLLFSIVFDLSGNNPVVIPVFIRSLVLD